MHSTKESVDTVIKVGLYCNIYNSNETNFNIDQLQAYAAFQLAIDEINNRSDILPNTRLATAVRSGHGAYEAVISALELGEANFSSALSGSTNSYKSFIGKNSVGIDVAVNSGDNLETTSMNLMLGNQGIVQFHTRGMCSIHLFIFVLDPISCTHLILGFMLLSLTVLATDTKFGFGDQFPFKIQMAPIDSYQGMVWQHIMCNYYGYRKFAIFSTADSSGIQVVNASENCGLFPNHVERQES
jgi:hypothetical protein